MARTPKSPEKAPKEEPETKHEATKEGPKRTEHGNGIASLDY
jgi:hypothetical protein